MMFSAQVQALADYGAPIYAAYAAGQPGKQHNVYNHILEFAATVVPKASVTWATVARASVTCILQQGRQSLDAPCRCLSSPEFQASCSLLYFSDA
jgi:hypothetical protein